MKISSVAIAAAAAGSAMRVANGHLDHLQQLLELETLRGDDGEHTTVGTTTFTRFRGAVAVSTLVDGRVQKNVDVCICPNGHISENTALQCGQRITRERRLTVT